MPSAHGERLLRDLAAAMKWDERLTAVFKKIDNVKNIKNEVLQTL